MSDYKEDCQDKQENQINTADLVREYQEAFLQILLLRSQLDRSVWVKAAEQAAEAMKTMKLD